MNSEDSKDDSALPIDDGTVDVGMNAGADKQSCSAECPARAPRAGWWRDRLTQPLRWPVRLAIFYAGVALPVICHLFTIKNPPPDEPRWQSGLLSDKLAYLLTFRGGWPVLPFLAFSIVCLALVIFAEQRFGRRRLVRWGVFAGVPVTGWYAAVFGLTTGGMDHGEGLLVYGFGSVMVIVVSWAGLRALLWLRRKLRIPVWAVVSVALTLFVVWCVLSAVSLSNNASPPGSVAEIFDSVLTRNLVAPVLFLFFLSLVFSTYWCLAAYLGMSFRLVWLYTESLQLRLAEMLGVLTWLAGFMAACRWAVVLSLAEYAKLPVEDPGSCYIASTAAKGKPKVVKSRPIVTDAGETTRVNDQLVTLKAGELAMRALVPGCHRRVRRIYDCVGPVLARYLQRHGCIEVGYFCLKPAEWLVRRVLQVTLGARAQLWLRRLYG